ncbi:MAG: tyrosine-type recombinase/integrase [Rhodospirillales bacterium]|nr:tyrosine-type recombinase/integrase [Rhodospirillales bacterium]
MHRRKGRRQAQARGLTWPLRNRLLDAADDRLIDDRNRALLGVAHKPTLRRAELTALQVTDLFVEMPGDATLLVRRSKTDTEGRGEMGYLACDTVRLVRTWLERSGVTEGRLFRSVRKCGALGERLDPSQVPRIFKEMACRAGLPAVLVEGLSGHSAQVGAAQDMIAAGIELPNILQAGRWKTTSMVNRYGERLLARRSWRGCRSAHERARPLRRRTAARGRLSIQISRTVHRPPP